MISFLFTMSGTCWRAGERSQRSWANGARCPIEVWYSCKEKGEYFFPFLYFLPITSVLYTLVESVSYYTLPVCASAILYNTRACVHMLSWHFKNLFSSYANIQMIDSYNRSQSFMGLTLRKFLRMLPSPKRSHLTALMTKTDLEFLLYCNSSNNYRDESWHQYFLISFCFKFCIFLSLP